MKKEIVKEYTNGEITVVWKPGMCIHSEKCFHGLPNVFNPNNRPWINAKGSDTDTIKAQIDQCPSGALSYQTNAGNEENISDAGGNCLVEMAPNGPLLVRGALIIKDKDGNETASDKMTAFCRCGASSNKPYCDGSHKKVNFEG